MSGMMLHVLGGISWEPEIRGALVTAIAITVLMGSVWLILATNVGHRLSTLLSFAGFFSWMAIMGVVWAIYGIGLRGDLPTWEVVGEVQGPAASIPPSGDPAGARALAVLDDSVTAPDLVERYCPGLVDAVDELRLQQVVQDDFTLSLVPLAGIPSYCSDEVGEALSVAPEVIRLNRTAANEAFVSGDNASPLGADDPRYLTDAELEASIEQAIDDETRKKSQLSIGALKAVAPDLIGQAEDEGLLDFGGWRLLSTAETGEALATADVILTELGASEGGYDASGDFLSLNVYKLGGKPEKKPGESQLSKAWTEVRNTVKFWHPDQYVVVQVVGTIEKETIEGQAPPFPEIDRSAEVKSVIMIRDRGSLRYTAIQIAIASFIIFLMLALMLHRRDVRWRLARDEWDPAYTGAD